MIFLSISHGRIAEIARILEVSIGYFFQEEAATVSKAEDRNSPYGFATKSDIQELLHIINSVKQEVNRLKAGLTVKQVKKKTRLK